MIEPARTASVTTLWREDENDNCSGFAETVWLDSDVQGAMHQCSRFLSVSERIVSFDCTAGSTTASSG